MNALPVISKGIMQKKIYLAGPISGLTYDGAQDWRNYFSQKIDPAIACYSPLRGKDYLTMRGLEGSYDEFPLSTDQGITARDRFDCTGADLVVFNLLGAQRITIGTMIELGWADAVRNPAILIMEKSGNPHDHPMVRQTTQFRVDNIEDAISIAEIILLPTKPRRAFVTGFQSYQGDPGDENDSRPVSTLNGQRRITIDPRPGIA